MTKTMGMRKTLQSAMMYPTVMISVIVAAMVFIVFFVIPSFKGLVADITVGMSDVELNLPTQVLFGLHDFFAPLGDIFPIALVALFIAYMFFKGKKQMAGFLERVIPKLRQVKNELNWGQWLLLGSVAIDTGMQTVPTLQMLAEGGNLPSEFIKKTANGTSAYEDVIYSVNGGEKLSDALKTQASPSLISNSIAIAESSGNLPEAMRDLSEIYLEGVDFKIKNVAEIINPTITIIIAVFVGVIVGSLLSVMSSINTMVASI